jgi:hypothetical protein
MTPTDVWTLSNVTVTNCAAQGGNGGAGGAGFTGGNGGKGGGAYGGGVDDQFPATLRVLHGSISYNQAFSGDGGAGGVGSIGTNGSAGTSVLSYGGGLAIFVGIGSVPISADAVIANNAADSSPNIFDPSNIHKII